MGQPGLLMDLLRVNGLVGSLHRCDGGLSWNVLFVLEILTAFSRLCFDFDAFVCHSLLLHDVAGAVVGCCFSTATLTSQN